VAGETETTSANTRGTTTVPADALFEHRRKQAQFRDPLKTLDNLDFTFNKKMNRSLLFELATGTLIAEHEHPLFLGPPVAGFEVTAEVFPPG
jgi:hypothetical protein